MQPIQFFAARAEDGALLPGATVDVFLAGTSTRAALYASNSTDLPIGNPVYADASARVIFYAAADRIDVRISRGGYVAPLLRDVMTTDPADVLGDVLQARDDVNATISAAVDEAVAAGTAVVVEEAGNANASAGLADIARGEALLAATAALAASNAFVDTTAGLAGTASGQVFLTKTADPQVYGVYANNAGVAGSLGSLVIADGNLITQKASKNTLEVWAGDELVAVMTRGGMFYLPGYDVDLKSYIDRFANVSRISSRRALVEQRDSVGALMGHVGRFGDMHIPGIAGPVAGFIRALSARQRELSAQVDAIGHTAARQTFYHAAPSGDLIEYNLLVKSLTATSTRKVKSWLQGKMDDNSQGHIMTGHNEGSSHGNSDTRFYTQRSEDGGENWTPPAMVVDGRPGKAADCFAYGIDGLDREWMIIRHRGANNSVGTTSHELFIRAGGVLTSYGELSEIVEGGFVPELFHDFEFVAGRMMSCYHFAASSRVGIISIDVTDPASRVYVDVIPHASGTFPPTTLVEGTLCWDRATGKIIGGLRTQSMSYAPRWFYINEDLTGFTMFNAPETVQYNPWSLAIVAGNVYTMSVERFNNGRMHLWTIPLADFYAGSTANAFKIQIGKIIDAPLTGSSETGVPHLVAIGDVVHFGFSHERADGYSNVYYGNFNPVTPDSWISNSKLTRGFYG